MSHSLQRDALQKIGCEKIFTDTASGVKAERKGLDEALEYVREGATLVVWRLDRLGRSLKHLIETIKQSLSLHGNRIKAPTVGQGIDILEFYQLSSEKQSDSAIACWVSVVQGNHNCNSMKIVSCNGVA